MAKIKMAKCPLLMMGYFAAPPDAFEVGFDEAVECKRDDCQWWSKGESDCVISIIYQLNNIAHNVSIPRSYG